MKTKRVFIGIFGRRNTGKSSLINAIVRQDIAIVSSQAGTTTDPVKKTIELFGIGPCVLVDTAGIDDDGYLGEKRIRKTRDTIKTIDVAIVLCADNHFGSYENSIIDELSSYDVPYVILHNKSDVVPLSDSLRKELKSLYENTSVLECSALNGTGTDELTAKLVEITPPTAYNAKTLIGNTISRGDCVVLVMPQDSEAPEGRLILPQVQLIRDILDNNAIAVGLQPEELSLYLQKHTPDLVITDSQAFDAVSKTVPENVPLTSFSIVLAQAKGNFENYLNGTPYLDKLQNGDTILMLESCTHPVSCEDIGHYKIPNLIRARTGKDIRFEMVAGLAPLTDISRYAMAIQCGACMVTEKQIANRIKLLVENNIPVSNYGMTIAYLTGIFDRVTQMFRKNNE
jgi:[FeFe] hydrogenase H-cluster maturation GTPase HydF